METTEKVKVADLVRNAKAKFAYVQSGVIYYEIESDTHVTMLPIDLYNEEIKKDLDTTRLEAEYNGITLMRYINKALKNKTLAYYEKRSKIGSTESI